MGVAAVLGYLLGSIPFGMVLAKVMGLGNLRDIGSGNIGATNVLRTGSKTAAALTLLLDGGKGAIAVFATRAGLEDAAQIAGLMAFVGHCFPVWLRFQGGKGVGLFGPHARAVLACRGCMLPDLAGDSGGVTNLILVCFGGLCQFRNLGDSFEAT